MKPRIHRTGICNAWQHSQKQLLQKSEKGSLISDTLSGPELFGEYSGIIYPTLGVS